MLQPFCGCDDARITVSPIDAGHGVEAHPAGCDVYLQPHAVVLDFMRPSVVLRRPVGLRRQARIDETGRCQWGSELWDYANATTCREYRPRLRFCGEPLRPWNYRLLSWVGPAECGIASSSWSDAALREVPGYHPPGASRLLRTFTGVSTLVQERPSRAFDGSPTCPSPFLPDTSQMRALTKSGGKRLR